MAKTRGRAQHPDKIDARYLKVLRGIFDMSQKELAGVAGVSESTIQRIEAGEKGLDPAVRQKLADGLGIPVRVVAEASEFVRYVDRESGIDPSWSPGTKGLWREMPGAGEELGEGASEARRAERRARHRERAATVGRAVESLVYGELQREDERSYDDY